MSLRLVDRPGVETETLRAHQCCEAGETRSSFGMFTCCVVVVNQAASECQADFLLVVSIVDELAVGLNKCGSMRQRRVPQSLPTPVRVTFTAT